MLKGSFRAYREDVVKERSTWSSDRCRILSQRQDTEDKAPGDTS